MMEEKAICFLTRCHPLRPKMLAACIESVETQSSRDFQHILIRDDTSEKGYGISKAEEALHKPWPINARYIMVLDDDNILVDMDFVRVFKSVVDRENPDIVFFRSYIKNYGILPPVPLWGKAPVLGSVDYFCFALRTEFYKKILPSVTPICPMDFPLIDACYKNTQAVFWLDRFVARTQGLMARMREQQDLP